MKLKTNADVCKKCDSCKACPGYDFELSAYLKSTFQCIKPLGNAPYNKQGCLTQASHQKTFKVTTML